MSIKYSCDDITYVHQFASDNIWILSSISNIEDSNHFSLAFMNEIWNLTPPVKMLWRHKLKYMMMGVLYVIGGARTIKALLFVNIYHLAEDSSNLNLDFPSFYFHKCILNQLNQILNHREVNPTPIFWQYYDTR